MISFAAEPLEPAIPDLLPYVGDHWRSVTPYSEVMAFDIVWEGYLRAEAAGMFKLFTARDDGRLVGYCCFFVVPRHLHANHRWANGDAFWLHEDHRTGRVGMQMVKFYERMLREDGPIVIHFEVPTRSRPMALLLGRLGYDVVSKGFSKRLA